MQLNKTINKHKAQIADAPSDVHAAETQYQDQQGRTNPLKATRTPP
jgi:hypothetical protein